MKIKTIAAICKKGKRISLYNGKNGLQWIGDGYAIYPLLKMPLLNEQSVFTVFDIPEDKQTDYYFTNSDLPEHICFDDVADFENILDRGKIVICTAGRDLQPLHTSQGIIFFDLHYIKPFADIFDTLELYERIGSSGQTYIAIKSGLILMGIVMPFNIVNEDFVSQLEQITQQSKITLFNKSGCEVSDGDEQY